MPLEARFFCPFEPSCFVGAFGVAFLRSRGSEFVDFVKDVLQNLAFDRIAKRLSFGIHSAKPVGTSCVPEGLFGLLWIALGSRWTVFGKPSCPIGGHWAGIGVS